MKTLLQNEEMRSFCSQLSLIMNAGVSAFEGISLMLDEQAVPEGKEILGQIYHEMEYGSSLCDAMMKTEVFPEYACRMVRLGETSGRLDEIMKGLAEYYGQEAAMRRTVRSAVSYPLFMLVMMMGVLAVLMIKVMPVFEQVFLSLGSSMDGTAGAVLMMGKYLERYSWAALLILILLLGGVIFMATTGRGRAKGAGLLRKSWYMRDYFRKRAQYRLSYGMSLCLKSGLNPEQSLELMEELVEEADMQRQILICNAQILKGESFSDALCNAGLFDASHNHMVRIGRRTGTMDQVMEQIAQQCEEQASDLIWSRIGMIEPAVVILLAVLVGTILLSVMLPLMSIMNEIG